MVDYFVKKQIVQSPIQQFGYIVFCSWSETHSQSLEGKGNRSVTRAAFWFWYGIVHRSADSQSIFSGFS